MARQVTRDIGEKRSVEKNEKKHTRYTPLGDRENTRQTFEMSSKGRGGTVGGKDPRVSDRISPGTLRREFDSTQRSFGERMAWMYGNLGKGIFKGLPARRGGTRVRGKKKGTALQQPQRELSRKKRGGKTDAP